MTPSDGEIIMNILEVRRKAVETVELSQRVEQLESSARNFQGRQVNHCEYTIAKTD